MSIFSGTLFCVKHSFIQVTTEGSLSNMGIALHKKKTSHSTLMTEGSIWKHILFFSIPLPGFISSDRFAWTGPLRLSFTDRRNSSLRSSDTTGRAFGKPNRILVPAPMVFRHKTLHLTAELTGKESTSRNLRQ